MVEVGVGWVVPSPVEPCGTWGGMEVGDVGGWCGILRYCSITG